MATEGGIRAFERERSPHPTRYRSILGPKTRSRGSEALRLRHVSLTKLRPRIKHTSPGHAPSTPASMGSAKPCDNLDKPM